MNESVVHLFGLQFCYESCKFKIQKNKEGTGRVVMWNMGIMNSYTMEARVNGRFFLYIHMDKKRSCSRSEIVNYI